MRMNKYIFIESKICMYKTTVRQTITNVAETRVTTRVTMQLFNTCEMRVLQMIQNKH